MYTTDNLPDFVNLQDSALLRFSHHKSATLVYLELKNGELRNIGRFVGENFYTIRHPVAHTFKIIPSLGFNLWLFENIEFKNVFVEWGRGILRIERTKALAVGIKRHYNQPGFEPQLFVELRDFDSVTK
jgi:hypothetical protein